MKLILHCGTSKTGTTSLQDCLNRSRSALAEHGVLYPDPMFGLNSHLALIAKFKSRERLSKRIAQALGGDGDAQANGDMFWRAFRDEVARTKPALAVLSCEYLFQSLSPAEMKRLVNGLTQMGFSVSAVVYIREPASWYASACQQDIKMGRTLKVPGSQEIRKPLEVLESVAGPVLLRKFARDGLQDGDIITDFLTHAMQRPDLLPHLLRDERNVSISAEACSIVEFYRQHIAGDVIGLTHKGTRKLINRIAALEAASNGPARPVLRPEIARQVRLASADYDWLRETHGISFAEYEAVKADAGADGAAPQASNGVPAIETVFEIDAARRDWILAQLLNDAVETGNRKPDRTPSDKPARPARARRPGRARAAITAEV